MFAIASLAALTLVGLLAVGSLAIRLLAQARRLQEELARTREDLEPRYREVRARAQRARADLR
ncbi:uncharacterized membrane-anchored protein YhcB (DUF1043 family) [Lipingzhangella halophila]|uniref:Uncharacterized membrane-anchored protein YhcB (DUF1043 family) n=1 Tax=Lipingzhangella halophila TaxID=1783352 RepID=A0A7W7W297_9ACTN|nr:hypothetical protein [Lipingzhangella halophila]MBB4931531.1 uncharacterized membrane-anchored protein YhcB (DUF1043 family) [Lipingzhangella halophila]